jgi:hypothetical protein
MDGVGVGLAVFGWFYKRGGNDGRAFLLLRRGSLPAVSLLLSAELGRGALARPPGTRTVSPPLLQLRDGPAVNGVNK